MTWLWKTFQEFEKAVNPIEATIPTFLEAAHNETAAQVWQAMMEDLQGFHDAVEELRRFTHLDRRSELAKHDGEAAILSLIRAVLHGEHLLGYNQRLVESKAGAHFIDAKHFVANPDYYLKQKRLLGKIQDFHPACNELLEEIRRQTERDSLFLDHEVELPDDLKSDFITARNLFSVGFDEAGLIYCGRGLEGVVRRIARDHNVGPSPTERARFFEILAALEKKRFAHDQSLVIEEGAKHLLHYSRTTRNQSAHPSPDRKPEPYREQAVLMAQKASELWKKCSAAGVKLV